MEQQAQPDATQTETNALYYVVLTQDVKYRGITYKGVEISWHANRSEKRPLDYTALIEGYSEMDEASCYYTEDFLQELFTEDEAKTLRAWMAEAVGENRVKLSPVTLPLPKIGYGYIGLGAHAFGGGVDQYSIPADENPLPFAVSGYFDVRGYPSDAPPSWLTEMAREIGANVVPMSEVSDELKGKQITPEAFIEAANTVIRKTISDRKVIALDQFRLPAPDSDVDDIPF